MLQPEMRVCKRCGMEKPITSYNKKDVKKWRTTCKQCDAIARKMRRISEKRLTNKNNTESRGTLCWRCKKAVGRCSWTGLDRSKKDERHICPLQLPVIERCVELWSNPGDIVLDPFDGIGSTGYQSILMGRRHIGVELKTSYFRLAVENCAQAERLAEIGAQEIEGMSLFDGTGGTR